jgi:adenylate cyclase
MRELCTAAGDKVSLAIGIAGLLTVLDVHAQYREASRLASEYTTLLEAIGDPTLTVGLLLGAALAKHEAGETADALRLAQRVIDLADGDPTKGDLFLGSPLALAIALRGSARYCVGIRGWKADFDQAMGMARAVDPTPYAISVLSNYGLTIPNGGLTPGAAALRETAETLAIAEQSGDDFTLANARLARGLTQVNRHGPEREAGFELLADAREMATQQRFSMTAVDGHSDRNREGTTRRPRRCHRRRPLGHRQPARHGRNDLAWAAATVLVESLLARGADGDLQAAQAAIDRLAGVPTDPGLVLHELPLLRLRALLARAHGDEAGYLEFRDRYRKMATELGFEGHIAIAEAMT